MAGLVHQLSFTEFFQEGNHLSKVSATPNPKAISNLQSLLLRTKEMREKLRAGEISLLNSDLKFIFQELQQFILPNALELSLEVMDNGTTILGQKLEQVHRFVSQLLEKEMALVYLKEHPSDEELHDRLMRVWHQPMQLPHSSIPFLIESWNRLIHNKKARQLRPLPSLNSSSMGVHNQITIDAQDPFETQMFAYFESIKNILPCPIDKLFSSVKTSLEYFEYFSYFLHLLQLGYLSFNKSTKIVTRLEESTHE